MVLKIKVMLPSFPTGSFLFFIFLDHIHIATVIITVIPTINPTIIQRPASTNHQENKKLRIEH